jgi:lipopolysaccharide export system protein LptA
LDGKTVLDGKTALAGKAALAGKTALFVLTAALAFAALRPRRAQAQGKKTRGSGDSALGGLGGDSKEPIKIDADKLDVLDKENRAVFTGNVVAVQGETTVRCTVMTVFYEAVATVSRVALVAAGDGSGSRARRSACRRGVGRRQRE